MPNCWKAGVCLFVSVLAAQDGQSLQIRVVEGAGAVVPRGATSSRRFAVEVTRGAGKPVPGANVQFRLPAEGPSGRFASGLRIESILTGADGRASTYGIRWGAEAGPLQIEVIASAGGHKAQAAIPVEISTSQVRSRADRASAARVKGPSNGAMKWVWIAAAGGGAALGISLAMQPKGSAPAALVGPPVIMPSIGSPSISVGRP